MSQEKTTLEIIAPSVEEAVAKGLSQLGIPEEAVEVEVLDQGSRGFFGLGNRLARVRLKLKEAPAAGVQTRKPPAVRKPAVEPKPSTSAKPARVKKAAVPAEEELDLDQVLKIAEQVVGELLEKMRVRARLKAQIVPPQDENDQKLILVEVQGDDLSILIGRRSETLNALQYISSLIISKEAGQWVPLLIDVQGYRARRERQLRVLARRMAEQVIQSGRRMALEPMPANERRIIHLELREHPDVTTESMGEEPNRKVTIIPKKDV
ncbi:MAG: RNA-binding cell elongation regulator Jag/EloR [Bellilinea sp.]|jgi:spoIIIJ-associated protein